jgi:hypothetical protein
MATFQGPTSEDAIALFEVIQKKFPHKTLGDDKWYLVAVSNKLSHAAEDNADGGRSLLLLG